MTSDHLLRLAREYDLVLGSASPRRHALLLETGATFRQAVAPIDESVTPGEAPVAFAIRMAREKAAALVPELTEGEVVLCGDTVVILGERILGKPGGDAEALETLRLLSGKAHTVCTALAFADHRKLLCSGAESTKVLFNQVTDHQINDYIATGEPHDKAGAYGIQGMGAFLVDSIEGSLDNVIGLPRTLLSSLAGEVLDELGHTTG